MRNLLRQKFYSFINIFGLTIGITISMLIAFYVFDELSYDKFHTDAERIYQVYLKARIQGKPAEGANTCAPVAFACAEEIPGVEDATRLGLWWDVIMRHEEETFTEKKLLVADSNFFRFFTFQLIEGDIHHILNEPNQIVLTESTALKYFDYVPGKGETPVGKMMQMGTHKNNCTVTGIMKNPPKNSHFTFDMVLSMQTWDFSKRTDWTSNSLYSYIKIGPQADPADIQEGLTQISDKHVSPEILKYTGLTLQQFRETGGDYGYYIQPMTDIRLRSLVDDNIEPPGDIAYVYLLSAISVFIILIACVNFMNLSTARSAGRAREVGIRKTAGAEKWKLVTQFLTESILLSVISSVLALGLIYLLLPFFNQLTYKHIGFTAVLSGNALILLVSLMILVGVIAGSYPAFYLTSFRPSEVLKGKLSQGTKNNWVRSSLVVFQFSISVFLIVCTLVIYDQLKMLQEKNLGFDKENILIIDNAGTLEKSKDTFRKRIKTINGVLNASISNFVPPHVYSNSIYFPNGNQEEGLLLFQIFADADYQQTLGLKMAEGRFFSNDTPADTNAVIINKTALKALGWKTHEGNRIAEPERDGSLTFHEVLGVLEDFNYSSLKVNIEPLIISYAKWGNLIPVRIAGGQTNETIKQIEVIWKEMAPGEPFDYTFLDQNFYAMFETEQRLGKIFIIFTSLAIFIACLGLFALATFMAEQRSKEIGIRKVMGASVVSVVMQLTRDFTKLVVISMVVALPAVILLMNWWLKNFAYKTSIGVGHFLLGGMLALVIAWITVSYQSFRAANTNPVNALRYE